MYSISLRNVLRLVLVAALAGFGLVAVAPGPATAAGVACQRTLSKKVDKPVEEPLSVFSSISVPDDGLVVADVDVSVNIHHAAPRDLHIKLESVRAGQARAPQSLFFREGVANGADMLGTTFDDEAIVPISQAVPPFAGRFRPRDPLSSFDGATGSGFYQLNVIDDVDGNAGTWNDWSLTLTYRSCDFDADGVEDHRDQCRDLTARTATGCPLTSRAVTAKYKSGKFRGALSSPVAGCRTGREVSVFRKRPGPDRRVGTATARADGSFRLARAKKRGRYYATSASVVVPDRAECPAVRSRTFRIR